MIRTIGLTKIFSTDEVETIALDHVDFEVRKGEFVAVMGPSGCGKSTLLNILGLVENPTSGQYLFNGQDVTHFPERRLTEVRRGNIGFVFQSFNLINELTIFENVELPLVYMGVRESVRRERVESLLERMKIGHRRHHFPGQLSGGQQQRSAIARAVIPEPKLILADEPTGNLDSKNGIEVMKLLSELNRGGTTIVMVTHSERDSTYSHRVVNLFDGRIRPEKP
jgi:putative ABC transport system ATP-binding protein